MAIGGEEIAAMIPHAGSMCLLESVLNWNARSIRCVSRHHRRHDNPLRRADGTIGAASGIEFAVQAMATHGYLVAAGASQPLEGYLVSLRDVRLRTARLDQIVGELIIDAERLMGDMRCALYRFALGSAGAEFISGRATVLLGLVTE